MRHTLLYLARELVTQQKKKKNGWGLFLEIVSEFPKKLTQIWWQQSVISFFLPPTAVRITNREILVCIHMKVISKCDWLKKELDMLNYE